MTDISNLKPGDALTYEQAMARADALRWVLEQLDVETGYATPIYDPYGSVGMERVRLRDLIEKELSE